MLPLPILVPKYGGEIQCQYGWGEASLGGPYLPRGCACAPLVGVDPCGTVMGMFFCGLVSENTMEYIT